MAARRPAAKHGLRRKVRIARALHKRPRRAWPMLRSALLSVWRTRGGGLYGLGYVVTFAYLEGRFFVTEIMQSSGVVDYLSAQLLEHVFRFGLQSMLNSVQALMWPVYLIQGLGNWGIGLLVAGFLCFDRVIKPAVNQRFPQLGKQGDTKECEG